MDGNVNVTVRRVGRGEAFNVVDGLADVLIDCVDNGASVSFLPPLSREKAVAFWRGVAEGVVSGERVLFVAEDHAGRILGTVQLVAASSENQPHRADVAKMLVRTHSRRRGIAQRLLEAAEEAARQEGKSVLVLDTFTGSDAERLYTRTGWQRVGIIPKYALDGKGGYGATTYFYKVLEP